MNAETANSSARKTLLLVGGTGYLGRHIGEAALNSGAHLRLLVRAGSRAKLSPLLTEHAEVVDNPDSAFLGVDAVVSALQGGAETIVDVQLDLLRRAREAGVRRFLPSDFSFDFFSLAEGENINSDMRRLFARRAAALRGETEVVHLMSGCFLDASGLYGYLGAFDKRCREAYLWGSGDAKMQFTTCADIAAYAVRVALDDALVPERVFFAGDSLSFHELVATTAEVLGRNIAVRRKGSLADLEALIQQRRQAEPANLWAWLPLVYWHGMLSGRGQLGTLSNARYPELRPSTVCDYAASIRRQLGANERGSLTQQKSGSI